MSSVHQMLHRCNILGRTQSFRGLTPSRQIPMLQLTGCRRLNLLFSKCLCQIWMTSFRCVKTVVRGTTPWVQIHLSPANYTFSEIVKSIRFIGRIRGKLHYEN